jgi:hypothetical protein
LFDATASHSSLARITIAANTRMGSTGRARAEMIQAAKAHAQKHTMGDEMQVNRAAQ